MARRVKCKICKKDITTDTAHIEIVNEKKFYCCNEKEFEDYKKEKIAREDIFKILKYNVFNYNSKQILPPVILKKINELHLFYSYEVILRTIKTLEDTLIYWANVENKFTTDYQKACYLTTIIANKINDVYKEVERENQLKNDKENTANEVSIDIDIINAEISTKKNRSKVSDITDFLD